MSVHEREGLIARIRHLRRVAAAADTRPTTAATNPDPPEAQSLAVRIAHLEQQLDGLQDSVHRESARQSKRIAELEAQIQPSALSAALSKDARDRGL